MKKLLNFFFLSAFCVFVSCEEEIAFNGSEVAPKLVVNCFMASDSSLAVNVSHSNSIVKDRYTREFIVNAQVKLYENSQLVGLLLPDTSKNAMANYFGRGVAYKLKGFKITAGNNYKLEVEAPNYEPVSTNVSIPKPVEIVRVDTALTTIRESWGGEGRAINFSVSFNDPPSEQNFYRIVIQEKIGSIGSYGNNNDYTWYYNVRISQSTPLVRSTDLSINPKGTTNEDLFGAGAPNSSMVFTDDLFDGEYHTIKVFTSYEYTDYSLKEFNEYTIELHAISKEYYLYVKSLELFSYNEGDPFAEPVQVYSNITNGFGIFAAYSISKKVFLDGIYPDESATYTYLTDDGY